MSHQAVVRHLEVKTLQVRNIARDVEGKDLPFSIIGQFVAASEAFNDEAALGRPITFVNDDLVWTNVLRAKRQSKPSVFLFCLGP